MKAQQVFTAMMRGKGYSEEEVYWNGKKFTNPAMQQRFNYFLAGWEMRGLM